eukprot:scaffold62_cov256-Pinguiococcus_pyrenoidosus.AAC.11
MERRSGSAAGQPLAPASQRGEEPAVPDDDENPAEVDDAGPQNVVDGCARRSLAVPSTVQAAFPVRFRARSKYTRLRPGTPRRPWLPESAGRRQHQRE